MMLDSLQLDDRALYSMMQDPRFREAIPCLAQGAKQLQLAAEAPATGCRRCPRKSRADRQEIMEQVRRCLVNLSGPQRQQLKRLAGAKEVTMVRRNAHNRKVRTRF